MATKIKKNSKALNAELGNALFSDVERWEMFFARHWKMITALALAGVVVITVAFACYLHSAHSDRKAATQLSTAADAAGLEAALDRNQDAPGADMARYRLAGLYIENKQYDKALTILSAIISGSSADMALRNKARMTEAYVLELNGKIAEAAKKFAMLSSFGSLSTSARTEASYCAGRLYLLLGRKQEARSVLNNAAALEVDPRSQSAGFWKSGAIELAQLID